MVAVIGMGFGDEGKGQVTDLLASSNKNPIVVRFSGGHQCGHTVNRNGVKHIFSNFGSGTLSIIPTYWSKFCTVDPIGLRNECEVLNEKNIVPVLYIDPECPVVTPYDKVFNKQSKAVRHGTCGVGFGDTLKREENYYSLKYKDLIYKDVLSIKLKMISEYYAGINYNLYISVDDDEINEFLLCCSNMCYKYPMRTLNIVNDYKTIIFEGSQGLLLDQHFGFFPHVTPSNIGLKNIAYLGFNTDDIDLFLVTRAYQTRHGNGPMTNEDKKIVIDNENETNVFNEYQGSFRTTMMDLDLLKYSIGCDELINKNKNKTIVVTCMDQLKEYALTVKGKVYVYEDGESFLYDITSILEVNDYVALYSAKSEDNKLGIKFRNKFGTSKNYRG